MSKIQDNQRYSPKVGGFWKAYIVYCTQACPSCLQYTKRKREGLGALMLFRHICGDGSIQSQGFLESVQVLESGDDYKYQMVMLCSLASLKDMTSASNTRV